MIRGRGLFLESGVGGANRRRGMRLFALILLSAGFASPASGNGAGDGAPTIVGTKTHQLALPASWSKALARKYPDLKMLSDGSIQDATRSSYSYSATEAPFAVVLDLNGDGRKDVALLAAEKGRTALLAMFAAS